jgi:hypothetical protein
VSRLYETILKDADGRPIAREENYHQYHVGSEPTQFGVYDLLVRNGNAFSESIIA